MRPPTCARWMGGTLPTAPPLPASLASRARTFRRPSPRSTCSKKASENRIEEMEPAIAVRRLLRNILFFAHQAEMVRQVFESACAFVAAVPVLQLSFFPDQRVWELIG